MKNRIIIEPLTNANSMGALAEIFSQKNINLVAVGSLPCVITLENRARQFGAENRVFVRGLSAKDYALGKNTKHLQELLNKALQKSETKGIIVYCSCIDVLTNFSEAEVMDGLINEQNIPIEFLYRGPLVKRKKPVGIALKSIWEKWQIALEPLKEIKELSQASVDVDFAKAILASSKEENILLVSPGGCASCLRNLLGIENRKVFSTHFDDIALTSFETKYLVEAIENFFSKDEPLLLLGSAVVKVVGISLEDVCNELCIRGYSAGYLHTDGFKK